MWAYDDPFAWQQSQQGEAIQTLYGPPSQGWCYDGNCASIDLGQAPSVQDAAIVWENRPTTAGLYWMEVKLPTPMPYAKLAQIYSNKKPPWNEDMYPLFCGAFSKIKNGQQVLVWGPEIDDRYTNKTLDFGDGEGQYQFNNALYAWGDPVTQIVDSLFFYGAMVEDGDTGGLDPAGINAYYNDRGDLLFEEDIQGNRSTSGQSLEGLPVVIFLVSFVVFLLSYFGVLGSTARRTSGKILTTLVAAGTEALGKIIDKLKGLAGKAGKAVAAVIADSLPIIIGSTVGIAVLWSLVSDSGRRR